jgi:hypothetical protein
MLCSTSDDAEREESDEDSSRGAVEGQYQPGDETRPKMSLPFNVNSQSQSCWHLVQQDVWYVDSLAADES